ncbi:DUF2382 domain-containing protein [Lysobacter korlensis]|uniref:DUF2382 domain-containing protein n=1 Tax=Lysobacter korlensis TaxID=553636 RepID=A0ABV6RUM6_9GAMM
MISSDNIASLIGADVLDKDGDKIGSVGQVYLDDNDGHPSWASVKTGLFGTKESFVPLEDATWAGDELRVNYDKDRVKDAPRVDADQHLEPSDEDELYRYYGMTAGSYGTDTGFTQDTTGTDYTTTDTDRAYTDTDRDRRDTVGHDTSGPTTDDAMTRSEEQLHVGTERVQTGKARLRKYVVTENQSVTVPVQREEVRIEREPITDANIGDAMDGPAISEEEHEVVLSEERPVIQKEAVPVERVRLDKDVVTEQQTVNEEVRKEEITFDGDDRNSGRSNL